MQVASSDGKLRQYSPVTRDCGHACQVLRYSCVRAQCRCHVICVLPSHQAKNADVDYKSKVSQEQACVTWGNNGYWCPAWALYIRTCRYKSSESFIFLEQK